MNERRVAVTGVGCRYARANNPEELWRLMLSGKDGSSPMENRFPENREYYHPDNRADGKFYNKRAYFLKDDITMFDADFFHISYKEAKRMDYQQRMLLKVSYEALLDAGADIEGSEAGVFIGAFMQDFLTNTMQRENYGNLSGYHATGSSIGMLSGRLSFFYNIHGPSMTVDTACSSSLTALHLASDSIRRGDCQTAICGGVNIITEPGNFITLSKGGFLSHRSISGAFGSGADGYARGEGVGVLILKDMEQAQRDRDHIYCEIVKTAVNHDGNKPGITFPNRDAQRALLQKIYGGNGIGVDTLGYLETHGTGTRIGDKTEAEALQDIFVTRRDKLPVGSMKTNIGHTEAASGIASVIKSILILRHLLIPPTIHCEEKNEEIPFDQINLVPVERSQELKPAPDGEYYIGINSFGFGGANAHAVLKSVEKEKKDLYNPDRKEAETEGCHLLYLSANTLHTLRCLAGKYKFAIQGGSLKSAELHDICTSVRRKSPHKLPWRMALRAHGRLEMAKELSAVENGIEDKKWIYRHKNKDYKKTAAVFSGMGIQTEDMGKELYRKFSVFRSCFRNCSDEHMKYGGRSLADIMEERTVPEDFDSLEFLQSYNLAYQISLFTLLQAKGILFHGCVGHSAGELASFYSSGLLTLEEVFRIAWHRGSCQEKLRGQGRMLAVRMEREEALRLCAESSGKISVGVENGKRQIVLSGETETLQEIQALKGGKFLNGSTPYHSSQMEVIREEFCRLAGERTGRAVILPLYSTVYGKQMDEKTYTSCYWWENIRNTVEFYKTLKQLKEDGYDSFIEIGRTPVLSQYIAEVFSDCDFKCVTFQTTRDGDGEAEAFCKGLQQAYINRIPMNFHYGETSRTDLPLPGCVWEDKKLPAELPESPDRAGAYLGKRLLLPQESWENRFNIISHEWLAGHKIGKENYLPAVFYTAMLKAAGVNHIRELKLLQPVIMDPIRDTILHLAKYKDGRLEAACRQEDSKEWQLTMEGKAGIPMHHKEKKISREVKKLLENMQQGAGLSSEAVYGILHEKSLCYEDRFRSIQTAWVAKDRACCCLKKEFCRFGESVETGILDALLQTMALAGSRSIKEDRLSVMLPVAIGTVRLYTDPDRSYEGLSVYAEITGKQENKWTGNSILMDESKTVLAEFLKVQFGRKEKEAEKAGIYTEKWEIETHRLWSNEKSQKDGYASPLIYKALGEPEENIMEFLNMINRQDGSRPLYVVTRQAMKILPEDKVQGYRQAALWGLVRCICLERPELMIFLVDEDSEGEAQRLLDGGRQPDKEHELAIRQGRVYVRRIINLPEKIQQGVEAEIADTAVITGASGGVAAAYALRLAEEGIKNFLLIARHETEQIRILQEILSYYEAEAEYVQADVTDRDMMRSCQNKWDTESYGRKHIYHLAGYNQDCPAGLITPGLLEKHMKPKAEGAEILSELIKGTNNSLTLVGSITAILGNQGQGCYAAANMLLHSLAQAAGHRLEAFGALDTGMAVREEKIRKGFEAQGIGIMDTETAVGAVAAWKEEAVYAAKLDWSRILKLRNMEEDHRFQYVRIKEQEQITFLDSWAAGSEKEKEEILLNLLKEIFGDVLGMEPGEISSDRNTDTMGIDSLSAAFIAGSIRGRLGGEIKPMMITGAFTLRNMAMRMRLEMDKNGVP